MIVMKTYIRHQRGKEERQCRNWKKKIEIVAGKEDNAAAAMMKKKLNISYLKRKGK